jgi:hypothetical protein
MRKPRDYTYWLYDHKFDNAGVFLENLRNLVSKTRVRINILLVASLVNLRHELKTWSPEHFTVLTKNSDEVFTIEVEKEFPDREPEVAKAVVVRYSQDLPVYLIVSDFPAVVFKNVVSKLMNKHYPNVARIFLTNTEVRSIFETLQKTTASDIRVDSSIAKRRIVSETRPKESQVRYTDTPFEDVFDDADAIGAWIQSIKFTAHKLAPEQGRAAEKREYSGIISRDSFLSCKGDFTPFINTVIPMAIRFASARVAYLKARADTASNKKPEPIVLRFSDEIFVDPSRNKQYIEALAQLDSMSISQYHSNPYMHLSMLDYLDGSSYDIWVISSNRMMIIPEFRASAASMSRLVNHIYERIHEGQVEEYASITASSQPG